MQIPKRLSCTSNTSQTLKLLTGERRLLTEETSLERVDLTCCKAVEFELRDEVPGVRFLADEHEGWTPIVKRKRKRGHHFPSASRSDSDSSTDSESSTDEIPAHILNAQVVKCHVNTVDSSPGLHYRMSRVRGWIPISPSPAPIAGRTRSHSGTLLVGYTRFCYLLSYSWS